MAERRWRVMLEISQYKDGVRFRVRVTPQAKRASVGGEHDGALKIAVTQPADRGKANKAMTATLAKLLRVPKSSIAILSGQTSRQKTVWVRGKAMQTAVSRLAQREQDTT